MKINSTYAHLSGLQSRVMKCGSHAYPVCIEFVLSSPGILASFPCGSRYMPIFRGQSYIQLNSAFRKPIIVVDIDNVSNDKSPISNGERRFRGMGLVFKIHVRNNK